MLKILSEKSKNQLMGAPYQGLYLQMDWSEPWLYCLIGFHLFLFTSLYFTRRSSAIQSFTFVLLRKQMQNQNQVDEW